MASRTDHWLSFVSKDLHYHISNTLHPRTDDNEDDLDHLLDPVQPPDISNLDLVKAGTHPRSPGLQTLASHNLDHCRVYDRHYCCLWPLVDLDNLHYLCDGPVHPPDLSCSCGAQLEHPSVFDTVLGHVDRDCTVVDDSLNDADCDCGLLDGCREYPRHSRQ